MSFGATMRTRVSTKLQEKYGGHGYKYMIKHVTGRMAKKGFTPEEIRSIFYENPANVFPY